MALPLILSLRHDTRTPELPSSSNGRFVIDRYMRIGSGFVGGVRTHAVNPELIDEIFGDARISLRVNARDELVVHMNRAAREAQATVNGLTRSGVLSGPCRVQHELHVRRGDRDLRLHVKLEHQIPLGGDIVIRT